MPVSQLFSVQGKVAIVTGAASGIGLACAEILAENGADVTLVDMNQTLLDQQIQRLTQAGLTVRGAVVDITDRLALHAAFDTVLHRTGHVDIVFANAGIDPGSAFMNPDGTRNPAGEIDQLEDALWDRSIAVMLTGCFNTLKAAARCMKPGGGSIIVTTSIAVHMVGGMVGTPYMPAKAGAAHLVRQAALDLARYNIRVNAIAPGAFVTQIGGGHTQNPAVQAEFAKLVPLGRMAPTDDIKGLALYLASDASRFVTGAEIVIDGGMLLGPAG
jgi:NAD(P)-dependent dehydrogenase (short-subunit alcohol dehydrogenase family)